MGKEGWRLFSILLVLSILGCGIPFVVEKNQPDVIYEPTPQDVVMEMLKMAGGCQPYHRRWSPI